jgi:hypothetical protein
MGLQSYGTPDIEIASQINENNILDYIEPWIKKSSKSRHLYHVHDSTFQEIFNRQRRQRFQIFGIIT